MGKHCYLVAGCNDLTITLYALTIKRTPPPFKYSLACKKGDNMETLVAADGGAALGSHVHTFAWIPQNDLIADPRVRLMVHHGGLNTYVSRLVNWLRTTVVGQLVARCIGQLVARCIGCSIGCGPQWLVNWLRAALVGTGSVPAGR